MTGVKLLVANPRRIHVALNGVAQRGIAAHELRAERVIKPAAYPLAAHDYGVYS